MEFNSISRTVQLSDVTDSPTITTAKLHQMAQSVVGLYTDLSNAREFLTDPYQVEKAIEGLPAYEHIVLHQMHFMEGKEFSVYLDEAQRACRLLEMLKSIHRKDMASMILPF